jgi:universal stress protein A
MALTLLQLLTHAQRPHGTSTRELSENLFASLRRYCDAIMIKLQTILVPVDFSDCSDAAIKYGYALAAAFGATLHLLHVVHDPYMLPWAVEGFSASGVDLLGEWDAQAKGRLAGLVPTAAATTTVLQTFAGAPDREIVRYAAKQQIDLIVLGTHGRGPLAHMLLGSIAERVVRTAPCPVLTVRHPQREFIADSHPEHPFDKPRLVGEAS